MTKSDLLSSQQGAGVKLELAQMPWQEPMRLRARARMSKSGGTEVSARAVVSQHSLAKGRGAAQL